MTSLLFKPVRRRLALVGVIGAALVAAAPASAAIFMRLEYVVFVWCSACGGGLIPAWKEGFEPQKLDVRP